MANQKCSSPCDRNFPKQSTRALRCNRIGGKGRRARSCPGGSCPARGRSLHYGVGVWRRSASGRSGPSSGYGHSTVAERPRLILLSRHTTIKRYFGWTFGLPPGLPGGGITGVFPAFGVGAFIPVSMSGGQITPLVWSSRSLSVWLLRSCSVQAFESVFCAQANEAVPIVIKRAASTFSILLIRR